MKRSEIIKLIDHALMRYKANQPIELKTSEVILNVIEDAGMLPPFTESMYNPHSDFLTGHEWEPED